MSNIDPNVSGLKFPFTVMSKVYGFPVKVINHANFWIKVELGIRGLKSSGKANETFWFNKRNVQSFVHDNYVIDIIYIGITKISQLKLLVNTIMTQ